MTGLRVVPERATETMLRAMEEMYMPFGEMLAAWDGALAAAPEPSPEQVASLSRLMWPESEHWRTEGAPYGDGKKPRLMEMRRNADCIRIKRFLRALQQPADEQVERTVG